MSKGVSFENLPVDLQHKSVTQNESTADILSQLPHERLQAVLEKVPEDDVEVRKVLLLLKKPEVVDNEDVQQRRVRLAEALITDEVDPSGISNTAEVNTEEEDEEDDEEFFTPATSELISARKFLVKYSLERSRKRLQAEMQRHQNFNIKEELLSRRAELERMANLELAGSQLVSTRPISAVSLSPNNDYIATGSWAGDINILNSQTLQPLAQKLDSHIGKIGAVQWHPGSNNQIISCAEDGLIKNFQYLNEEGDLRLLGDLVGHERRVSDLKYHPSGQFIGSASHDMTWRLWDASTYQELLLQEGHAKGVFCLSFQCDGSLVCSGGMDSLAMIWDIRSGNKVMSLTGHSKPIYTVDWSTNGYQVATGGGDGLINVWDIRQRDGGQVHQILAHRNIVTKVQFSKDDNGKKLISCGYDNLINVYSSDNWLKVASLEGHTDKIISLDISNDSQYLVSGGWDRSVKIWN
ncbi:U4/U6 small nuclear ribonucleoprotein prp4 [Saccharomyces pastorianus]|uniref:U4/U6 small nuclear ribonucleoprotein prp4 n=1 Tax=Saccharomyces pastorianus TaxID=27292 RepID=A0A6C1E290_SACPS|nr:U4/U6 small nuclear ribonucleoprotein prp4 [Saccharomyces pastorianus]